jgi:hypothetical protein
MGSAEERFYLYWKAVESVYIPIFPTSLFRKCQALGVMKNGLLLDEVRCLEIAEIFHRRRCLSDVS